MPRLSPRHVTEPLQIEQYSTGPLAWAGAWTDPVTVAAQVEHRQELVATTDAVTAHTVLVARIPAEQPLRPVDALTWDNPQPYTGPQSWDGATVDAQPGHTLTLEQLRDRLALLLTLNSRVTTARGRVSYVLGVREVLSRGRLMYVEVTTGDVPPRWGGWLVTDAVLVRTAGRDRRGDPTPGEQVPIPEAVFRHQPGQSASTERVDEFQDAETKAEMILPPASTVEISTTDQVLVPSGPMAGRYQVDGRPDPRADRVVVPLLRRA